MNLKIPRPKKIKKRKQRPPKGYDSWFEYDLHKKQLKGCKHHEGLIEYVQVKRYEIDFTYIERGFRTYIETKGRFRDRGEARKYVDVRNGLAKNEELVFVFQNSSTPMPGARKRQDGTKLTMAEWADKNGFRWFTPETLPAKWAGVKR